MELQAGSFLESTDAPGDGIFGAAVVYLTGYNSAGAVGVIINQPFGRKLNELQEFRHSVALPLFSGGPVATEHLFFLHRRPDLIDGGTPVGDGAYWGGDFQQAIRGLNNGSLAARDLRVFVGYCGWDAGDLESEIRAGGWRLRSGTGSGVFNGVD